MPVPNLNLCRRQPPDNCLLGRQQLLQNCTELVAEIEQSFPRSYCLGKCHSSAKDVRKALLNHFNFPTHNEGGKILARGIYILFDGKRATRENAFYVGVGNDVPKRLTNHLSATSHQQSSLLYLLMKRHLPAEALVTTDPKTGKPKAKKRDDLFKEFSGKCAEIRDHLKERCSVVIHPVPDILTLHTLEAMLSLEFKTGPWNSFRPH
jgi:hypothetical protein